MFKEQLAIAARTAGMFDTAKREALRKYPSGGVFRSPAEIVKQFEVNQIEVEESLDLTDTETNSETETHFRKNSRFGFDFEEEEMEVKIPEKLLEVIKKSCNRMAFFKEIPKEDCFIEMGGLENEWLKYQFEKKQL